MQSKNEMHFQMRALFHNKDRHYFNLLMFHSIHRHTICLLLFMLQRNPLIKVISPLSLATHRIKCLIDMTH